MIIGLTGQSGAGKTTLSEYFSDKGFVHINCDLLAREVVQKGEKCLDDLCDCFGEQILLSDGQLDRKKLASIAFSDKKQLENLNRITHKHIKELLVKRINQTLSDGTSPKGCIIDAPTLFEAGVDELCDITIAVLADENIRLSRIMKRDGLTESQALTRIKAQKTDEFYKEKCTYFLYNDTTEADFKDSIKELYSKLAIR